HARLYAGLPGARLVAVVDRDGDRARLVGERHGVPGFADLTALPDDLEAVSVAVPTVEHAAVTEACLARGLSVLVEKPMAPSVAEAESMVAAAARAGRLLLVGHTERFNPAFRAVASRLRDPRFIEAHRLGVFTARSTDIDVVLDLMIHDLDLVLSLVRGEVAAVDSVGVNALTDKVDIANARLRFENGAVANLTASRISTDRVRKLRIFEADAYLSLDTAEQSAVVYRLKRGSGTRPEIVKEEVPVEREEPLAVELRAFVAQVRGGPSEGVSARDGLRALRMATRILEQIG
ncbi:MAG TPA: Gfo/Idh/MocA family oxidoreductase, partial [Candidatus Polarisedimenticolia bacterium]